MDGTRLFATVAQPAMSPPPPTGVTRASSPGMSSKSSSAADLEGSRALEVLTLEEHAVAARVVERLRRDGRGAVDPIAEPPRRGVDVVDAERGGRTHDGEIIYSSHATTARARAGPAPRRLLAHLARPHATDRAALRADGRRAWPRQDPPAGHLWISLRRGWPAEPRHRRPDPAAGALARARPRGAHESRGRPGGARARGTHRHPRRGADGPPQT